MELNRADDSILGKWWWSVDHWTLGAIGLFNIVGSFTAGWLGDRWSRRHMMVIFFYGIGLSMISVGFVQTPLQLGAALFAVGLFASIGIKKGAPFSPDARMKKILTEAVAVGNATARAIVFASRDKRAKIYPDRQWSTGFVGGSTNPPPVSDEEIRAGIEPNQLARMKERGIDAKGLAPAIIANMIEAFRELKRTDTTILVVEQNFHFARSLGDAVAQTYPSRTIRQIVPYASGSAADALGRFFFDGLLDLGVANVVERALHVLELVRLRHAPVADVVVERTQVGVE